MKRKTFFIERLKNVGIKRIFFFLIAFAFGISFFGIIVTLLWNAILPDIFKVQTINFWQALGLILLSKIFFSSFYKERFHLNKNDPRIKLREKWIHLSPEERERFIEKIWGKSEINDMNEK